MSEADLREGLLAAIGDEPPLNFDADELIRRAEHVRRRRRALVAVAVATLALTGTALSLPGELDRGPGIDAAQGPVLTITAAPSSPTSTKPVQVTPKSLYAPAPSAQLSAGTTKYLATYLSERFTSVVPGVEVLKVDFTEPYPQDRAGYLTGVVRFRDDVATSVVVVQLSTPPLRLTREEYCAVSTCGAALRQGDGTYLESATVTDPESDVTSRTAVHFRSDGSVVQVSAYDHDPITGGDRRSEVALTAEQLTLLAVDPLLRLW
ncbi:hypothetical protein [Saccharothrix sp. NRRL B-16314]|uniref:hypothetical protein n=1 Tax=Saccharothrix sp. NRRL B-16314 TaxID=1463825 RepID=UPI000525AEEB|nr:hypothetical protein [Saccharothrix sp. NRRL B-16314]